MQDDVDDLPRYVLSRFDSYFSLASLKAALVLPANALLLGVTLAGLLQLTSAQSPNPTPLVRVFVTITLLTAFLSTAFALWVTFAFLKGGTHGGAGQSLLFFGNVRTFERNIYAERFLGRSKPDLTKDILGQVHVLAGALHGKYLWLNWSLGLCAVGYASLVVVALLVCWGA